MTSSRTVLVIDDDRETTRTFARMLRLEGFQVRTAESAESGLQEAESGHPDAIILDLRMPVMDGLAFLHRLRSRPGQADIPVAIVTGDYLIEDSVADELMQLGAQIHFKPLWMDDLLVVAHSLLAPDRREPDPPRS